MYKTKIVLLLSCCLILIISCDQKKEKEVFQKNETKLSELQTYRSKFHFTPESAWMNDPNGLVYNNGIYHLFYQYYPDSTVWGPMHWGHATSKDLLAWKHKPIALFPDSLGYIFSGSAVIDKSNSAGFGKDAMVAIFTYHNPKIEKEGGIDFQTQGIAYSVDDGDTWTKFKGNPVIDNPGIKDFRDPKVFWNIEKKKWQMVLVAQDHVQFYESDNLIGWTKISEFRFNDEPALGVWECPDLFKLSINETNEEKWVLILSHGGDSAPNGGSGTRYFVGNYDGTNFTTNQKESLWIDYGTDNYAGVTFNNVDDRRIFIGWMSNWDYAKTTPTKEWRSAMTLPRELSLYKKGDQYLVKSEVISELASLTQKEDVEIKKSDIGEISFSSKKLQQSIISFDTEIKDILQIELSNNIGNKYLVNYNPETGIFYTDRTKSGIVNFNEKFTQKSKQIIEIGSLNKLTIQIVLDASSIEIFINNGEFSMTNQVFPKENLTNFKMLPMKNSTVSNILVQNVTSVF
tara:strand:+ start:1628 stop:3172 length:1545 start_codon:yes stop_codon:yes gene_type:complete